MITRFAPSPTGYLHLGHAYSAEQAFGFARDHGGTCLLRIEDIDHTRCKPEFTDAIYEDLRWLGYYWPRPPRVQSAHRADYAAVIDALNARGLIYRCFKKRSELPKGVYIGEPLAASDEKRRLSQAEPFAWRLSTHAVKAGGIALPDDYNHGDVVLARKDIGTSYHIAVTHDDHIQGVTDVVRGADLADQTPIHRLIQTLMGWPHPNYHHHALIMDAGKKLSKRDRSTTIRSLREAGLSPSDVLAMARAKLSG